MTEPTPMQWQPIDTIPKDGTWVLLYTPRHSRVPDDQVVWTARWAPGWAGGLYVERWSEDGNNVSYLPTEPTHWMPCPGTPFPRNRLVVEKFNIPKQRWQVDKDTLDFRVDITEEELERWIDLCIGSLAHLCPNHAMTDREFWRVACIEVTK